MSLGKVTTPSRIYTLNDDRTWTMEPEDDLLRPGIEAMTAEMSGPADGIPGRMVLTWLATLVRGEATFADLPEDDTKGRIY